MGTLCSECPPEVKGTCCNIHIPIGSFNILLEHVVCPYLDSKTKECTIYEDRLKLAPWCLPEAEMFGKGGLPEGCLYIKEHPEKEPNPKQRIQKILPTLSKREQAHLVGIYNLFNNIPFMDYTKFTIMNLYNRKIKNYGK